MNLLTRITERAKGAEVKDLYELHPELEYRIPIMRILSGAEQGAAASGGYKLSANFYNNMVWVNKAIKVLKDNISQLTVQVVNIRDDEIEPQPQHPFSRLLDEPNPEQGAASFWEEWVVDMLLGGEWGIEAVYGRSGTGLPVELWPRQPHIYSVIPEEGGKRYRRVAAYHIDDGAGEPYDLDPQEFIHFKFYNPLSPWRGLAPISAVRMGIVIDQLAQAWTRLFFKNQARPDWALIAPQGLTKTERNEYMEEVLSGHSTGYGLHRPIILEQGVTDIKTLSFPPKDLEWLEQRRLARDEVGGVFGVPDEVMGYGRDTYENFDTADRVLWTLTISPLVQFRDRGMTRWAMRNGFLQAGQKVMTDLDNIPQLQEDRSAKVEQYVSLVQNRIPPQMASDYVGLGLADIPEGDIVYIPFSMVPAGSAGSGQPPQRSVSQPVNKAAVPEYGSSEHEALWKRSQDRLERPLRGMQRELKRYFQDQQNDINRRLRASRDFGRGKFKEPDVIPPIEHLFNIEFWVKEFVSRLSKYGLQVLMLVGDLELGELGVDLEGIPLVERPQSIEGIRYIFETVAQKTNETTWTDLTQLFQEAEQAGEGIPAIQERLSAYFGDRKSDWQTERIARTTMTGAANFGTEEAWQASGVVKGKTWISALQPGRTRDAHATAHRQTVPLAGMFDVGGELLNYPGDPSGSASNIINCLCTMTAEVME